MTLFSSPFSKASFSPIHTRNGAVFFLALLSKPFSKASSVFISLFGPLNVDDRRKRIKKYVFSCENALVWSGP